MKTLYSELPDIAVNQELILNTWACPFLQSSSPSLFHLPWLLSSIYGLLSHVGLVHIVTQGMVLARVLPCNWLRQYYQSTEDNNLRSGVLWGSRSSTCAGSVNGLCSYAQILISYAYLSLVGPQRGEQPHFPATCSLFPEAHFTPGNDPVPIPHKECLNSALRSHSTFPICQKELLISLGQEKSSQQFYSCVYNSECSINTALNLCI